MPRIHHHGRHHGPFGHHGHFGRQGHFRHHGHFGHRHGLHGAGGRSHISAMDLMVVNQMTNPINTRMMTVPVGNYYGILGSPGGARATISSPGESLNTSPNSVTSSAVVYPSKPRYSQNAIHNNPPVGFEGVQPVINRSPSVSNVTVDYHITSANGQQVVPTGMERYHEKEPYIDHFPEPGRTTPDSLTDIHQAPPLRRRRRRRRDPREEDRGCCAVS